MDTKVLQYSGLLTDNNLFIGKGKATFGQD